MGGSRAPPDMLVLDKKEVNNGIIVEIDGKNFTRQDMNYIQQLSEIVQDSGEEGKFDLGNLHITINSLETFEKELIVCKKY